jgi:hypothetical protein
MFKEAERANVMLTWILRGVGFLMMFLGLNMVLRPFAVVADVLPILGSLVGAGTGLVAAAVAICLTLVTIAISWLAARPLLAIGLLVLAVAGVSGLIYLSRQRKKRAEAPAATR